jgi:3-deoxy-7-phosphoheptulonate synthase
MQSTNNLNVTEISPLTPPHEIKQELPMTEKANAVVVSARQTIRHILDREDHRLFAVVGPCSIHDPKAAMEYAERLKRLHDELKDRIYIIMRVYFEKPRTTIGWKGLINDPDLNGTHQVEKGLRLARKILLDINELGLPAATETLDPITPQYIAELLSWSAIGARTTESQTHREMTSGLSMPVGFKNGTDGGLEIAVNAIQSASEPHHFLGINGEGLASVVKTTGNRYCHIVLRGGKHGPNFDALSIQDTEEILSKHGVRPAIMVDCSHGNSNKRPEKQEIVLRDIVRQIVDGNQSIVGTMIESHLHGGNQKISPEMQYGVSITDKCLDWESTERALRDAYEHLGNLQYLTNC